VGKQSNKFLKVGFIVVSLFAVTACSSTNEPEEDNSGGETASSSNSGTTPATTTAGSDSGRLTQDEIAAQDALRQVVFLRAYAQKTPINEYKQEAFGLFEKMLDALREDITQILLTRELRVAPPPQRSLPDLPDFLTGHIDPLTGIDDSNDGDGSERNAAMFGSLAGSPRANAGPGNTSENPWEGQEISRNAPCPCGSGNKYKHCHGAFVTTA